MNKIETFDKFNNKMKRRSKSKHLERCGFSRCHSICSIEDGKPSILLKKYLDDLSREYGCCFHGVSLRIIDHYGAARHEFWRKII